MTTTTAAQTAHIFVEAESFTVEHITLPLEITDADLRREANELFASYPDCRIVAARHTRHAFTIQVF